MKTLTNEDKLQIINSIGIYRGTKFLDGEKRADLDHYYMTQLNTDRILCNINAIEYIINNNILGDIVEIGVWRGGSMLSMLKSLELLNITNRSIHLYDTFNGMTETTDLDTIHGVHAKDFSLMHYGTNDVSEMCRISLDEVKNNINIHSNYPSHLIHYHVGDITQTQFFPDSISVLRLDTDWYESTKFELENFYDKVSSGGIIIIDDYGCWYGCQKATNDFIQTRGLNIQFINATDGAVYFYKP